MRYTKIKFMKCMLSSLIASSLFCILNTQVPYKQVRWSLYSLKHNITIYGFTCVVNTVLILPFDNVSRKRYSMCLTVTYLLFRIIIHRIAVYKYKAFLQGLFHVHRVKIHLNINENIFLERLR